jgi:hypothetical protein
LWKSTSFPQLREKLLVIAKIVLDGLGMIDVDRLGSMEEVDLHRLILRYGRSRIRRPRDLHRLADSIERHGQSSPVATVAGEDGNLVLIDGYLRVEAARRCGKDTVLVDVWPCKEDEAIARVLSRSQERPWEAIEQAALIAELQGRFGWSEWRSSMRVPMKCSMRCARGRSPVGRHAGCWRPWRAPTPSMHSCSVLI